MTATHTPTPPRPRDATVHWVFLVMAVVVLSLSFLLRAPGGETVVVPILNQPLPGVCTFKRVTGAGCPGCGLTRSFISIAHGEFRDAWAYNPAGALLFVAAAFQVPFRAAQIGRIRRGLPEWRWPALNWCLWLLALAMLAQWLARMVFPTWP